MAVSPDPHCLRARAALCRSDPGALGLRFGVTRTGCSGWGHVTDLARDEREGDTVFEQDGVKICVDAKSLALVDGTVIDFGKHGLSETFTFSSPMPPPSVAAARASPTPTRPDAPAGA
ncbi:HesB/IscA family protein [Azotobacter sp. CWF10]